MRLLVVIWNRYSAYLHISIYFCNFPLKTMAKNGTISMFFSHSFLFFISPARFNVCVCVVSAFRHTMCGSICFNCNLKYAAKAIVWNRFFPSFGFRFAIVQAPLCICSSSSISQAKYVHSLKSFLFIVATIVRSCKTLHCTCVRKKDAFVWKLF